MKQFVPIIIAGVFIVAGGAGGFYLKSSGSAEASTSASGHGEASGSHGEDAGGHGKKDDGHGKAKKSSGGHGGGGEASADTLYYKFSREFVIPIIGQDRVRSMVIINLNLEIEPSISQKMFSMEPKLRDNIMTTLINLSSEGDTLNDPTNSENYEMIKSTVLSNLRVIVPEGIDGVLIQDMAKQDL